MFECVSWLIVFMINYKNIIINQKKKFEYSADSKKVSKSKSKKKKPFIYPKY